MKTAQCNISTDKQPQFDLKCDCLHDENSDAYGEVVFYCRDLTKDNILQAFMTQKKNLNSNTCWWWKSSWRKKILCL